eukprot:9084554-Pyramimonas_sp.AAC.1
MAKSQIAVTSVGGGMDASAVRASRSAGSAAVTAPQSPLKGGRGNAGRRSKPASSGSGEVAPEASLLSATTTPPTCAPACMAAAHIRIAAGAVDGIASALTQSTAVNSDLRRVSDWSG